MADLAATDITLTKRSETPVPGLGVSRSFTVAFGDGSKTYPAGGVPVDLTKLGCATNIASITVEPQVGNPLAIRWAYDRTNKKLRGYRSGPRGSVVVEELVTVDANKVGYLKNLPAHVYMIEGLAGSTGVKFVVPTGSTLASGLVDLNFTTGKLLFNDAVTSALVSYIPLAALANPSDLVVDETPTVASNKVTLAGQTTTQQAVLVQYAYATAGAVTGTKALRDKGATLATTEAKIDWTDAAATPANATTITFESGTDLVTACKVTYVKANAFMKFVEEEAVSLSSEEGDFALGGVPGNGQWIPATAGITVAGPWGASQRGGAAVESAVLRAA